MKKVLLVLLIAGAAALLIFTDKDKETDPVTKKDIIKETTNKEDKGSKIKEFTSVEVKEIPKVKVLGKGKMQFRRDKKFKDKLKKRKEFIKKRLAEIQKERKEISGIKKNSGKSKSFEDDILNELNQEEEKLIKESQGTVVKETLSGEGFNGSNTVTIDGVTVPDRAIVSAQDVEGQEVEREEETNIVEEGNTHYRIKKSFTEIDIRCLGHVSWDEDYFYVDSRQVKDGIVKFNCETKDGVYSFEGAVQ